MGGLLSKFRRGSQREAGSGPQNDDATLSRGHQSEPQLIDEPQDVTYNTDTLRSTKSEGGLLRGKKHGKKNKGSSSTLERSNEELEPEAQKAGVSSSSRSSTLDRNTKSASLGKGATLKGLFRSKSSTLKRTGGSKDSLDKKTKNQQHSSSEDVQGNFFTRLFRRSSRDLRKKHREPREQRSKSEEKELLTPPRGEEQLQDNEGDLFKVRSSSEEPQLKAGGQPSETPLLDTLQQDAVTQNTEKPDIIQERSNTLRQVLSRSQERILEYQEERREFLMNKTITVTPKSSTETKAADTSLPVSQNKEETKDKPKVITTEETDSTEEVIFEQTKQDEVTRKTESDNQEVRLEDSYEIIDEPEVASSEQAGSELKVDLERLQWEAQKIRGSDDAIKSTSDEFEVLQIRQNEEFSEKESVPELAGVPQKTDHVTELAQKDEDSSPKISPSENIDNTELFISEGVTSDEVIGKSTPHMDMAEQSTESHETCTADMPSQQDTKSGEIQTEANEAHSVTHLQGAYENTELLITDEKRAINTDTLEAESDVKTGNLSEVKADHADKEIIADLPKPETDKIGDVKPTEVDENITLIAEDSSKIEKELVLGFDNMHKGEIVSELEDVVRKESEMTELEYQRQDVAEYVKTETEIITPPSALESVLLTESKMPAEDVQEDKTMLSVPESVNRDLETMLADVAISDVRPRDIPVSETEQLIPQSPERETYVDQQQLLQLESISPVCESVTTEGLPRDGIISVDTNSHVGAQADKTEVEIESDLGPLIPEPVESNQNVADVEAIESKDNYLEQESMDTTELDKGQSQFEDLVSSIARPEGSSEPMMQIDHSQTFETESTSKNSLTELIQKSEENILDLEDISIPAGATLGLPSEEQNQNQTLFETTDVTKEQPLLDSETGDNVLLITTSIDQTAAMLKEEQTEAHEKFTDMQMEGALHELISKSENTQILEEVCNSSVALPQSGQDSIRQESLDTTEMSLDQPVVAAQTAGHASPITYSDNRTEPEWQREKSGSFLTESSSEVQMESSLPEIIPKPEDLQESSSPVAVSTAETTQSEEKYLKPEPFVTPECDPDQSVPDDETAHVSTLAQSEDQKEDAETVNDVSSKSCLSETQDIENTSTDVPEDTTAMLQQVVSDAYSAAIDELKSSLVNEEEQIPTETRTIPDEMAVVNISELLEEKITEDQLALQDVSERITSGESQQNEECDIPTEIEKEGELLMSHEDTTETKKEAPILMSASVSMDEKEIPEEGLAEPAIHQEAGAPQMFTEAVNERTTESGRVDDPHVENQQSITDSSIPERDTDLQEISSTEKKEDNSVWPDTQVEVTEQPPEQHEPSKHSEKELMESRSAQNEEIHSSDSSSCLPHEFIWEHGGQDVYLCGSFNNWMPVPLSMSDGVFKITLHIPEGKHYYRYIVDEETTVNPSQDAEGDLNCIELKKAD